MKKIYISLLLLLSSCTTYSVTMVHSEGSSSDMFDEQQTPSTTVNPNIMIPITP
jgi:hypothetical protein